MEDFTRKSKNLPERKWIDRIFVPKNVDSLELYTVIRTMATTFPISLIFAWVMSLSVPITSGIWVTCFFSVMTCLSLFIVRLGFHRLGRILSITVVTICYVMWAQFWTASSFAWVFLVNLIATISFYTTPSEEKLRLILRAIAGSGLAICIGCYWLHVFPVSYSPEVQNKINVLGYVVVVYAFLILFKAVVSYRKEVIISRQQLEAQAMAMLQQAKMSSLGEMAGGVAHEINNPLAMILGHSTQLLRKTESLPSPDREEFFTKLEKIQTTVMRISKIVSALRSFSRNADEDPLQSSAWNEILEATLNFCGENMRVNHIELRMTGEQGFELKCRPTQISQVLVNLLNNSFEATRSLTEKWVEIHTENNPDRILIMITDSGKGIPNAVAEKIMQPFFTTKEIGKGTGLGLSVSKGIIESHGGSISLDRSCPNTRFVIELPLR